MISTYSFVQSPHFEKGRKFPVSLLIIHFTAGGSLESAVQWFQNSKSGVSAHYVIGQDGRIVQMVHEGDKANHAGGKTSSFNGDPYVNSRSIGIELVNWGDLKKVDDQFFCWPDKWTRPYDAKRFGDPKQASGKWWAPYRLLQIVECNKLCADIIKRHPGITQDRVIGHEHVDPSRKNDPGPLFDFNALRKLCFNSKANSNVFSALKSEDSVGDDQLYAAQSDNAGD